LRDQIFPYKKTFQDLLQAKDYPVKKFIGSLPDSRPTRCKFGIPGQTQGWAKGGVKGMWDRYGTRERS
jgi:hypothetical protein